MSIDLFKETMEIVDEFSALDRCQTDSAQLIYLKEKFYPRISEQIMSFVKGSEKVRVILDCDPTKKAMLLQVKRLHEKEGAGRAPQMSGMEERHYPTIHRNLSQLMVMYGEVLESRMEHLWEKIIKYFLKP